MLITFNSLYRDTVNFFKNQFVTIFLIVLITSCITFFISKTLSFGINGADFFNETIELSTTSLIDTLHNLSPKQQKILLRASAIGTFASLIGNVLLLGGMLSLINIVSSGKNITALKAIINSVPLFPTLFLLTIIMTILIQLGFGFMILPGLILSVLLALAPIILFNEKLGVLSAIKISFSLGWKKTRLITPAIIFWIITKILIVLIAIKLLTLPQYIIILILNIMSNLTSALLIIYISRLYMLIKLS